MNIRRSNYDENMKIKYNKHGYFVKNKQIFKKKRKVTVITPVYNAENFLEETIKSVIAQSIGFENIEFILVDDNSTDNSRNILWRYANAYKNIFAVFLEENSGSPSLPRNLGIDLASSEFVLFLDSDDWLSEKGLEVLYELLEETNDDYAVGRTIKVTSNGKKIIGEYQSISERKKIPPSSIDRIFHHLGPPARMIRRSLLIEKKIRFPHMKFAEDKQFFIDVLTNCETISTTNKVVYYVNRKEDNNSSLTTQTSIMEKTDTNITVIHYVKNKSLPTEIKKMVLNRLYEFDCITRLFDRQHFLKSNSKMEYFEKYKEVLATTRDLNYEISELFFHPINKVIHDLLTEEKYEEVVSLIDWNKNEKKKKTVIVNGLPYFETPFTNSSYNFIRIPLVATFKNGYFDSGIYKLNVGIFGDYLDEIEGLAFRNRNDFSEEYLFDINKNSDGDYAVSIDVNELNKFSTSKFEVFIRFAVYNSIGLTKLDQIEYEKRRFDFYTTINSNLGFRISKL